MSSQGKRKILSSFDDDMTDEYTLEELDLTNVNNTKFVPNRKIQIKSIEVFSEDELTPDRYTEYLNNSKHFVKTLIDKGVSVDDIQNTTVNEILDYMNNNEVLKLLPRKAKLFSTIYYGMNAFGNYRPQAYDKASRFNTHINIFWELYMAAGYGKDEMISELDTVFKKYNIKIESRFEKLTNLYNKHIKEESLILFTDKQSSSEYFNNNRVRLITSGTTSKSTTEGIQALSEITLKLRFGSVSIRTGELDALLTADFKQNNGTLLSEMLELYDAEKLLSKTLVKSSRIYGKAPVTLWGHTSPENIANSQIKVEMYKSHFSKGMVRRSMICIVNDNELKKPTPKTGFEAFSSISASKQQVSDELTTKILNIQENLDNQFDFVDYKTSLFTESRVQLPIMNFSYEADILFIEFFNFIKIQTSGELNHSLPVKAKKIAMTSALFKNQMHIDVDDIKFGIQFVWFYLNDTAKNQSKTFNTTGDSPLFSFLMKNIDKDFKRTELVFEGGYVGTQAKRMELLYSELESIKGWCAELGLSLEYAKRSTKPIRMVEKNNSQSIVSELFGEEDGEP